MALIYKTPTEVADDYLQTLKTLKPEVDIGRADSDWYIRSRVLGGVLSGVYGDQKKIADDAFPQSARRDAMSRFLSWFLDRDFNPPQPAAGLIAVTGDIGTSIPMGTEFVYAANGNSYQCTADQILDAATGLVPIESVGTGQAQNILTGQPMTCSSPPSGLNPAVVTDGPISDGRDAESVEEAAQAVLDFVQQPPAGGTAADYARFAREADPSVVDANVIRFMLGLGTIGIVITAGTTDIDGAVDNNIPVVREPSADLIEQVQDYVDARKVVTDCVTIFGPTVIDLDVEVNVRFASGDQNTMVAALGLTQGDLVRREVKRAIYKTPPGGRRFGASGYIVASEIEEVIDLGLSALPHTVGSFGEYLLDRQVADLSLTGANRLILPTEMAEPGTITITEM